MRRLALALLLAACGSSRTGGAPPPDDGHERADLHRTPPLNCGMGMYQGAVVAQ